mgnify:FL=1|jgi:hypothetical protein|tara:strand:- start:53 stop:433 length:381 start_codon:yes stop_codon:yes gene_type:complete
MGHLKTDLLKKLKGLAPFEQIIAIYQDKSFFFKELNNYLVGGMVISNPAYFMMLKPIIKSQEASGQWFADNPDTWYVRWVAGQGCVKAMMDAVSPLPFVQFRRISTNGETALRTYAWEKLYKKVAQ